MRFFKTTAYIFGLLAIIFIPIPSLIFSWQEDASNFLWKSMISAITRKFFAPLAVSDLSSDSYSLYILLSILLIISLLIAAFIAFYVKKWETGKLMTMLRLVFSYYLAAILLGYGADKIFKGQFYLPEPNILYTPFGFLDRDILFWSTMGTSYSYNFFTGLLEVICSILLIARRTRRTGIILSGILLLHIVVINFSFDISVKLYSSFLLFLSIVLVSPYIKEISRFLFNDTIVDKRFKEGLLKIPSYVKAGLKSFIILILCFEAFYPYIRSGHLNDDMVARPYLHGAYQVQADTRHSSIPVSRFFVHRDGYLIFQESSGQTRDLKLYIDTITHRFRTLDHQGNMMSLPFKYDSRDSLLELEYKYQDSIYLLKGKALDWKDLPALSSQFHWAVDEIH